MLVSVQVSNFARESIFFLIFIDDAELSYFNSKSAPVKSAHSTVISAPVKSAPIKTASLIFELISSPLIKSD